MRRAGRERGEYPPVKVKLNPIESISMIFHSKYLVIFSMVCILTQIVNMRLSRFDTPRHTLTLFVKMQTIDSIKVILYNLLILIVYFDTLTG